MSGRPTKLTDEVQEEIEKGVLVGLSFEMASGAAGVTRQTYYNWVERGRRWVEGESEDPKDERYARFFDALTRAKDECARIDAQCLRDAATGALAETITEEGNVKTIRRPDWRAAESRLKRRFRDDWGDKQNIDHAGDVTVTRVVVEGGLDHIKPAEKEK